MGSTLQPLPFGPTTGLQFAMCYVNLAVPSSAGRLALTTRFYQRFGIPPASALSASVIDSLSEFLVQVVLFTLVFFVSDVDLGLSLKADQLSGLATFALIVIVALLIAAILTLVVPSLRKRVQTALHQARDALQVLRSPRKLVLLYGGNLLSQLLFAITLGAVVRGFGYHVPLSVLILINTTVSLFAGLLPVPGGVGVAEAGLSLGLTCCRNPGGDRLRDRTREPVHDLLPAPDLGLHELQVAHVEALPLKPTPSVPRWITGALPGALFTRER